MKIDGIDPLQLNKIHEQTQKPVVQESHRQDPKRKQQDRILNREQNILAWKEEYGENLKEALEKVNTTVEAFHTGLRFRIHEETERVMVQIVNLVDDEVIKEIPPEKLLNVVAQIQNIIGLFIDTRR
ncbi:MAG: flagellar protein FlaG [Firmicutes bacterium]|nr:flagellar protein FlaG [Bacillota bacterium]